ncbi:MAG: hypothetical protein MUO82_12125, partial [Candidatus Thermoplasmatota archaeon]|nr:hypothetical protein [Candidatus Thermoplasmatota archaeon]
QIMYNYSVVSSDSSNHDIIYEINWGDGSSEYSSSYFESNESQNISHRWEVDGTYLIQVQAIDYYGAESDWATLEVTMPKIKSILNIKQGEFAAEIGVGDEEETKVYLEGNYRLRGRFTVLYGTATNGEQEVRYQGLLRGNHFILQIPIRERIVNTIGRYTINENREFSGRWTARGIGINGWIKGTIS